MAVLHAGAGMSGGPLLQPLCGPHAHWLGALHSLGTHAVPFDAPARPLETCLVAHERGQVGGLGGVILREQARASGGACSAGCQGGPRQGPSR